MTQSSKTKTVLFSALSLIANSALVMGAQAADIQQPSIKPNAPEQGAMNQLNSNQFEASFLNVYAGCKVDHASFEPVSIEIEKVSDQVLQIHTQLGKV